MGAARQLPFSFALRDNYAPEDFLVSDANREAFLWVDGWNSHGLVVLGPQGSGKTHLLHMWKDKTSASLLTPDILRRADLDYAVRAQPCWALDDADRMLEDNTLHTPLFHWFNLVAARGGAMLLAARTPLARQDGVLADLRSRLGMLPAVAVQQPDDALLSALLVKLMQDRQLHAPKPVVEYLLAHGGRSFEAVQQAVAALDRLSLAEKRAITVPLVKRALAHP